MICAACFCVAFASVALALAGDDVQGQEPLYATEQTVKAQLHKQKMMRSEVGDDDAQDGHRELRVLSSGGFISAQARGMLAPDATDTEPILSEIHAMSLSHSMGGLAPTVAPVTVTSAPVTPQQVPNNLAAFEIAGAGIPHFNGMYMPSTMPNTATSCTSLTWEMENAAGTHYLYNINGAWTVVLRGHRPPYSGADDGNCTPETAAWQADALDGVSSGTAPTAERKVAGVNPTTPTPSGVTVVTQSYFVVTNAGIASFNGVYYMTELVVANERCERTYAKDNKDSTEYMLTYENPKWYFQSMIGATMSKPYSGQDDLSCAPENTVFAATDAAGGSPPQVVRSATATTTTSTSGIATPAPTTAAPQGPTTAPYVLPAAGNANLPLPAVYPNGTVVNPNAHNVTPVSITTSTTTVAPSTTVTTTVNASAASNSSWWP